MGTQTLIPATQEAETKGLQVCSWLCKISVTLPQKQTKKRTRGLAQVIKYETLNTIPSTAKNFF
jgi:hypothetical protein